MNIDGRAIAADILRKTKEEMTAFGSAPIVRAVVVAPSPATESYLKVKSNKAHEAGMEMDVVRLADDATTEDVIVAVQTPGADAIIVQLPLPAHLDLRTILDAIPAAQDADVLSSAAYDSFVQKDDTALLPPVVGAVQEILMRSNISARDMNAVVLGSGRLVGMPVAEWLDQQGAEVTVLTKESPDQTRLGTADLIVSGAGSAHFIQPSMISDGVVLIDAGTSESSDTIAGDADPACAEQARVFTPVPGGVGPIAVACLFRNVGILVKRAQAIAQ
jgi:5,10-methylene-tetrahydrofolate dehydrogenase/methenyl tetrahydrofolate cyclohydrolase